MNRDILAAFWRFTVAEVKVAVRRYFMLVRVIAHGMYQIAPGSDAKRQPGSRTPAQPHGRG